MGSEAHFGFAFGADTGQNRCRNGKSPAATTALAGVVNLNLKVLDIIPMIPEPVEGSCGSCGKGNSGAFPVDIDIAGEDRAEEGIIGVVVGSGENGDEVGRLGFRLTDFVSEAGASAEAGDGEGSVAGEGEYWKAQHGGQGRVWRGGCQKNIEKKFRHRKQF